MKIIHIAPDIGYLFPNTASTSKVLCGRLAKEVLADGEFIGLEDNLNPSCVVCDDCDEKTRNKA